MSRELQPVIITASRATDIPAYYGEWFMNRMNAGFCDWVNPFNREIRRISFARTRAVVFWTKNAIPFMNRLDEFEKFGIGYYFTYTLNNYVDENWEPGLPSLGERIESFLALSKRLGCDRVVWRYDPIILSDDLNVDKLLERFAETGKMLTGYCRAFVTSFVDIANYQKVRRNLAKIPNNLREPDEQEKQYLMKHIADMCERWGMKVSICSEHGNWSERGVRRAACVDGDLLRKLYPRDTELLEYLSPPRERNIFTGEYDSVNYVLKDRGQRKECGCIASKDIGAYNTCPAGCVYCYANSTSVKVDQNIAKHNATATCLTGELE